MTNIVVANTSEHFKIIETLADIIWREHYIPIIGLPQVNYMLKKFQSAKAIKEQVEKGFEYYLLFFNDVPAGYLSIKKENEALFLSKIYVVGEYRGRKIGKAAMVFVEEKAETYKLDKIRLTVNINNVNSIKAYEKLGFKNVGPVVADIGNGFVMDDYEMIKEV
ncbi:GNAT family N-acetyltransferase [Seonamhaeicola sp.]|uniref:GNAT family N-acetyltransferase n=1 Tax=Seonamhaeicola sp. TaxID=1912245 RepID=UPI0026287E4F|nr:GNAT family N-acetyltransferase [Seonamhaeicola sp.]